MCVSWGRNMNGVIPRGAAPLSSSTCCIPKIQQNPCEHAASVHTTYVHVHMCSHRVSYPAYLRDFCIKLPLRAAKQWC